MMLTAFVFAGLSLVFPYPAHKLLRLTKPVMSQAAQDTQTSTASAKADTATGTSPNLGNANGILGLINSYPGPVEYSSADLPKDMGAYRISSKELNPMATLLTYYAEAGLANSTDPYTRVLTYVSVVWSKGDEIAYGGQIYLVGYSVDTDSMRGFYAPNGAGRSTLPQLVWHRSFFNENNIAEIAPEPNLSVTGLQQLLVTPRPAPKAMALSSVKELVLAELMYSSDDNDRFPSANSSAELNSKIQPYLKNASLAKSLNPNGGRILFNLKLGGVVQSDIPNPPEIIAVYDENPWPSGEYLAGYADGHAAFVNRDTFLLQLKNSLGIRLPHGPGHSAPVAPRSSQKSKKKSRKG